MLVVPWKYKFLFFKCEPYHFVTVNYLVDVLLEQFDLPELKFERVTSYEIKYYNIMY